jgi:hypothetical protein
MTGSANQRWLDLDEALGPLRSGINQDGMTLRLESLAGSRAVVALEAGQDSCPTCIVPVDVMSRIITLALREADPTVDDVLLVRRGFTDS